MSDSPFLVARGLRRSYVMGKATIEVLRGVDLTIERGEFVALRGASGAGKSTLLHLLGGLDLPDGGEIHLDGVDLRSLSLDDLAQLRNKRVGLIFQAYFLLPELSALENVVLPARMARVPAAEANRRARGLLTQTGLGQRMEHRPYELSGGEQQRVAIARALINNPDLILADEPTGNLDSRTGDEILQILGDMRVARNATFVIATHDANLAARAPRVIELVDGQLAR
jgi:ABC-type lipoprotein export system ATPase subunit